MAEERAASEPGARPLGALLLLLLVPLYAIGLGSDALTHGDEAYWISAGSKAVALLRAGELGSPDWQTGSTASVLDVHHPTETAANRNPKLGVFLIGAGLHAADAKPTARWNRDYAFTRDAAWNRQRGLLPEQETLRAGRLPVALLSAVAGLWFYLALCTLVHPGFAVAFALLLATNPLVMLLCRRAMLDGPAYAFSIGAILFAMRACTPPPRWAPLLATAALACAALSSKLNAGILLPILATAFAVEAGLRRSPALLLRAAMAGCVAAALFVALNPTLYIAPLEGLRSMLRLGGEIGGLGGAFREASLPTLGSRISAAASLLLWENGVVGVRGLPGVDVVLLPLGVFVLAVRARGQVAARVLLLWLGFAALAVCVWPPVRWDRYFLPALAPIAAAECVAVAVAVPALTRRWQARRSR